MDLLKGWISTTEAAKRLGITPGRMRQLVAARRIKAELIAGRNHVRIADLATLKNRPNGRPPEARGIYRHDRHVVTLPPARDNT